jgi:hypothetical protein
MVRKAEAPHAVYILERCSELFNEGGMLLPACLAAAVQAAQAHFHRPDISCEIRTLHSWRKIEARLRVQAQGGPCQPRVVGTIQKKPLSSLPQPRDVAAARIVPAGAYVFVGRALSESVSREGMIPSAQATTDELVTFGLQRATSYHETTWRSFDCLLTSLLHLLTTEHLAALDRTIISAAPLLEDRVAALRQRLSSDCATFSHAMYWYQNSFHLADHLASVSSPKKCSARASGFLEIEALCKIFRVRVTVIERCLVSHELTQNVFEFEGERFWQTLSVLSAPISGMVLFLETRKNNHMGHYTPLEHCSQKHQD